VTVAVVVIPVVVVVWMEERRLVPVRREEPAAVGMESAKRAFSAAVAASRDPLTGASSRGSDPRSNMCDFECIKGTSLLLKFNEWKQ